jgi:electron transport complex protein RnfA
LAVVIQLAAGARRTKRKGEGVMSSESIGFIFVNAALINNFVLSAFLGICPFIGVSKKIDTATRMGMAVTFVMFVSSVCAYGIHQVLLIINAPYLQLISYIVVIASAVQLVEMFIKKFSPALFRALGIFLPLITTNCAILGLALFQTNRQYDFLQSLVYALGAGVGFTLAIVIMAGIREELELAELPDIVKGTAIVMVIAGILSLSFMGFAGLGG